jgi:glucose/arabinose dehydrogenase
MLARKSIALPALLFFLLAPLEVASAQKSRLRHVLTGPAAFTDYKTQQPGVVRRITVADLPGPYASKSVDNGPDLVSRPADAWPKTLPGFKVGLYAGDLKNPRLLRTGPNGDVFLAESSAGEVRVFRGIDREGKAEQVEVFASGLAKPFGIAIYPPGPEPEWVYVANTDSVVRFPLPQWGAEGPQSGAALGEITRWRTSPRWRPPDAGYRVLA